MLAMELWLNVFDIDLAAHRSLCALAHMFKQSTLQKDIVAMRKKRKIHIFLLAKAAIFREPFFRVPFLRTLNPK